MNRFRFLPVAAMLLTAVFAACTGGRDGDGSANGETGADSVSAESADRAHNARNSLDWSGVYGNDTMTVELNGDYTFMKRTPTEILKGSFMWDTEGSVVALDKGDGGYMLLKVEENRLTNGDLVLEKR